MVLNKKIIKNITIIILALLLTCGMLLLPKVSVRFALAGLDLWFTKMIPTLFPFMVVSGILIRLNLVKPLCKPFSGLFSVLFRTGPTGTFCIIIGFLCGFPMGAKVISDLYKQKQLTLDEASFLLSFCNNIGPIYFCGFVLTTLNVKNKLPFLFGMYGIPLLYGFFLCRMHLLQRKKKMPSPSQTYKKENTSTMAFMEAVDDAVMSAIDSITKLGGYMIFFNLFNLLPRMLMQLGFFANMPYFYRIRITHFFSCFFEISNGVNLVKNKEPWLVLTMIPLGGLCCLTQTYSLIKDTPLSLSKYALHKCILAGITGIYYFFLLT